MCHLVNELKKYTAETNKQTNKRKPQKTKKKKHSPNQKTNPTAVSRRFKDRPRRS